MARHTPTRVNQHDYTKKRKTRSDKGTVQLSKRDIYCLAWIAENLEAWQPSCLAGEITG